MKITYNKWITPYDVRGRMIPDEWLFYWSFECVARLIAHDDAIILSLPAEVVSDKKLNYKFKSLIDAHDFFREHLPEYNQNFKEKFSN
ncbi:hypothetical protein ACG2LH_05480 [Zhouia sp. PK063]|uniref:hypothetical protein n=1 Tax=Zhouia sp. PK063 TaxID=3373602 RepID=UPI0037890F86